MVEYDDGSEEKSETMQSITTPLFDEGKTGGEIRSIVSKYYPNAQVGGVTADSIEGAILRVNTRERVVYMDTIDEMREELGEDTVGEHNYGIQAREILSNGDDKPLKGAKHKITLGYIGDDGVFERYKGDVVGIILRHYTIDGYTPGWDNNLYEPNEFGEIEINPEQNTISFILDRYSFDRRLFAHMDSLFRTMGTELTHSDSLKDTLTMDEKIELEKTVKGVEITQRKVELIEGDG